MNTLYVSDLDGTLLRSNQKTSEFTNFTINNLVERGMIFSYATGAMKAMLDHFGYRWMPHRPAKEMFGKRAVIITQCLGAGESSAAKDIKDSLSWWGVSSINVCSFKLMSDILWEKIPNKKRKQMTAKLVNIANKIKRIDFGRVMDGSKITDRGNEELDMENAKSFLTRIRKPDKNTPWQIQILVSIGIALTGIAIGVFQKYLDSCAINELPVIL